MVISEKDREILALLAANAREPIAELARKLNLSRSTVKDRIARLERQGVIVGYGVKFSEAYQAGQIQAHVMISTIPKYAAHIVRTLQSFDALRALHTVNGVYDMIAIVSAASTLELDQVLDQLGEIEGIEKTVSSIILSTKIDR